MFKWKRTSTDSPPVLSPTDSVLSTAPLFAGTAEIATPDDEALDAFARVLRALGQHAFDLEQESAITFSQVCEAWARHLLILAPAPTDGAVPSNGAAQRYFESREWAAALHFVQARRQKEQQHVNKALGDLRQGIWAFAQSLGTVLVEDQRADNRMKAQIDRLKLAVEQPSTEDLKKEMMSAANSLSEMVGQRPQAQRVRLEELGARVTDLAGQLRDAKQENVRDGLTQLTNRKGFDEFMNRMVFMRDVFGEAAALLIVDADHFKKVNDMYGHPGGDAALRAIADCLVRNFPRKSDMVARYGGEELAVVLPDTSPQNAVRLAERTRLAVRELQIPHGSQAIGVTISVGVAQIGRHESVQSWLERADQALYQAKSQGRDRVVAASEAE
ncbi:MAG TPA: GGDEF domain-containing protein [Chloroflexota bacterium]|nr:GGDEF domain-containing protein [Chloroflexota bacterium]